MNMKVKMSAINIIKPETIIKINHPKTNSNKQNNLLMIQIDSVDTDLYFSQVLNSRIVSFDFAGVTKTCDFNFSSSYFNILIQ